MREGVEHHGGWSEFGLSKADLLKVVQCHKRDKPLPSLL